MKETDKIDTTLYCKYCKLRLNPAKFQSMKFGVGHIGYEVGKYCRNCRILFIFNKTIKIEIMYLNYKGNLILPDVT